MKGGRRDRFFFCLLEFFPEEKRWFLSKLIGLKDDSMILDWIQNFSFSELIVDFPLNLPACHSCSLECPGLESCSEPSVVEIKKKIEGLLKESTHSSLSRSFKRRLKKGFLPYWNRSLDFWIWSQYYDQLLQMFNFSFDSFGQTSLMIQSRFHYLRRHFPDHIHLWESSIPIILLELLKVKIICEKDIQNLSHLDKIFESRFKVIKKIENSQNIFIYNSDLEILCQNSRAFDSFLLAVAGQNHLLGKSQELPLWSRQKDTCFIAPHFI